MENVHANCAENKEHCIFCKILHKEIPAILITESDKAFAFMDIFPLSQGHCLV
jgi:histidine triad (HIT) family protein